MVVAALLALESLIFIGEHARYHEIGPILMSAVLGLLLAFISCGPMVLHPIF